MTRNLILCCDGTGQKFAENKSNPLRFHYCLNNQDDQLSFYDPGVGTFDPNGEDYNSGWFGDFTTSIAKTVGGAALGYGIVKNIEDAYRYLMSVFQDGDKVFLIGFSRGAFTAQAIAGLLNKCGLLYPHNENLIPYTLRIYLNKDNDRIAREFKQTMARRCKPHMLGVWDTVKSLGDHHKDDFFYASPRNNCAYGYHAVAIDETREDFRPNLWGRQQDRNHREVWFPGVHGDVGGGYPEDGLANGALRWMIARATRHGVHFHARRVNEFTPDPAGTLHDSRDSLLWHLRGAETRHLPAHANIHASALDRRERANVGYEPTNLPSSFTQVTE